MKKLPIIAASSTILLSACGGGDGIMSTRTFAADTPTPALALAEGKTLTAQAVQTAAMNTDYANATTSIKESVVSIAKGASGHPTLTVNGRTYEFTDAHRVNENAYATDGAVDIGDDGNQQWKVLISYSGDIDAFLNGTSDKSVAIFKYRDIEGPADDFTQNFGEQGFVVIGAETQAAALGEFTTKSYSGRLEGDAFGAEGFSTTQNRNEFRSDNLTLTANFEENTISGTAGNILIRQRVRGEATPDYASVGGEFLFQNGTIDGADFAGTLSVDDTFKAALGTESVEATFSGSFFGAEGEAVGGVIKGTATDADGASTLVGAFTTD